MRAERYPSFRNIPNGSGFPISGNSLLIAKPKQEQDALGVGFKPEPAKVRYSVDIANLAKPEAVVVSKPRGRPKKVVTEIPPNLG